MSSPRSIIKAAAVCVAAIAITVSGLTVQHEESRLDARSDDAFADAQVVGNPYPYNFPRLTTPDNLFPMPKCHGVNIEEATIDELQKFLGSGILSSRKLLGCYVARHYQVDQYTK